MEYRKITKKEFLDHAVNNGIALLGVRGCNLAEAITILDSVEIDSLSDIPKTKCTVKGQHLMRGTSHLHLDKNDSIYKAGVFYIVHSFSPADNHCSFESHNCIFYI